MVDLVAFGDAYIAVGYSGDDAAVWASDTGAAGWHLVDTIEEPGWQAMREIVESDGSLQVVGWQSLNGEVDAAAWRSEDGIAWERVHDPELEGPGTQELWTALPVDGTVIGLGAASDGSGGTDAAVWRQDPDGWTRLDLDLTAPGDQEIRDVALSRDGTIVAVGITGDGSASDARIWTSDASELGEWEVASGRFLTPLAQELLAVVATDQGFVAMGWTTREGSRRDGWIWTSPTGSGGSRSRTGAPLSCSAAPQTQEVHRSSPSGPKTTPSWRRSARAGQPTRTPKSGSGHRVVETPPRGTRGRPAYVRPTPTSHVRTEPADLRDLSPVIPRVPPRAAVPSVVLDDLGGQSKWIRMCGRTKTRDERSPGSAGR